VSSCTAKIVIYQVPDQTNKDLTQVWTLKVPNEAVVKIVIRQELLEMILVLLTNEIIYGFFFFFDDMLIYTEKIISIK
jgi:hypothetical protein